MKKVVILLAIATLLATPAFAGIRNSKHDLSSSSTSSGTNKSDNTSELCVFCHTPHGGATGGFAPLWNRSVGSLVLATTELYNSVTLEATVSGPTAVVDEVIASDAKLCLSCHDGTSLATGLLNPPSSGTPTFAATKDETITGFANLYDDGKKLTNDHPIGMAYNKTLTDLDGELIEPNTTDYVDLAKALRLYPADSGNGDYVMWCSTCHDVHNSTKGTPFLNMSNTGSAMCLTCHDK